MQMPQPWYQKYVKGIFYATNRYVCWSNNFMFQAQISEAETRAVRPKTAAPSASPSAAPPSASQALYEGKYLQMCT